MDTEKKPRTNSTEKQHEGNDFSTTEQSKEPIVETGYFDPAGYYIDYGVPIYTEGEETVTQNKPDIKG